MARKIHTEANYRAMYARIEALETTGREYLADEMIDNENTGLRYDHPDFWNAMYDNLCMSAGMRAEGYGFDINAALNEVIY